MIAQYKFSINTAQFLIRAYRVNPTLNTSVQFIFVSGLILVEKLSPQYNTSKLKVVYDGLVIKNSFYTM